MESVHEPQASASDTGDVALSEIRRLMRQTATIDQAKIAIAAHLDCSEADALAQLVRLARDTGTSLSEVTSVLAGVPIAEPDADDATTPTAGWGHARTESRDGPGALSGVPAARARTPAPPYLPARTEAVARTDVPSEVRGVLDLLHISGVFLRPLSDADGEITDFLLVTANESARARYRGTGVSIEGALLSEIWPESRELGLYDQYLAVLAGGAPIDRGPFEYRYTRGAPRTLRLSVRAGRVADGLVVTFEIHEKTHELAERLAQIEEMTALGWAEWNLSADEIAWSDGMYRILGRPMRLGPMRLEELTSIVLPADLPLVQEGVRSLFDRHEPTNLEFRIRRGGGVAWVRGLANVTLDGTGNPATIRATLFDITDRRRGERALESARAQIIRQRQTAAAERRVARELRQAILPVPEGNVEAAGLRFAVRYLAAESGARIGGDWYTVNDLPDGRVLIGIGDAAGHGLEATALMARMRSGLGGLSYTGARSGKLMTWLNELVCFDAPQTTATAAIGHYDPVTRELTWTRAGHPPPVLVRDGVAQMLSGTDGTLLGAVRDQMYRQSVTRLRPGDLLLFYTDGLVERRDADIDDGIAALADAAAACTGDDPAGDIADVLAKLGLHAPEDDTCLLAIRVR